jgi:uncharacterized protein
MTMLIDNAAKTTYSSVQTSPTEHVRTSIAEAARIVAPYWPISTFIASNILSGLESMSFSQAMQYAHDLRGSQGYLPLVTYKKFYAKGRITDGDLDAAITLHSREAGWPNVIKLGNRYAATPEIFKSWLLDNENLEIVREKKSAFWQHIFKRLGDLHLLEEPSDNPTLKTTRGDQTFARDGQTVTDVINKRMITWCAAFLDDGQAAWTMPGREKGFYAAWKNLAGHDKSFEAYTGRGLAAKVAALPENAENALVKMLTELQIAPENWAGYLTRHLAQLPGWASLIRWRGEHPEVTEQQKRPINLTEYLAVRLFYENTLVAAGNFAPKNQNATGILGKIFGTQKVIEVETPEDPAAVIEAHNAQTIFRLVALMGTLELSAGQMEALPKETLGVMAAMAREFSVETQQKVWQEAYEIHYRQELLGKLGARQPKTDAPTKPAVQAVFCIDVRSEGFRRNLEKLGAYKTYGFAGFFGVPILYRPLGSSFNMTLAPALLTPTQEVQEVPHDHVEGQKCEAHTAANNRRYTSHKVTHGLRENLLTPFAFVEMVGWLSAIPLLGKTLAPRGWRNAQKKILAKTTPQVLVKPSIVDNPAEMSLDAQANAVAGLLKSIGLTKDFARLVFLCGHGSETENNPYASALDCGACGGNRGGMSAFVAASVLNSSQIREILASKGIIIPATTFFLAGEHNTTTDTITFMNADAVPGTHWAEFEQFARDLATAGEHNAAERWQNLPGATGKNPAAGVQARAADWGQVRPEWGLVKNAAFICGRREITAGLNLDNRTFLHSYDAAQDPDGAVLEGIMTAPVVVAEWINMQYYLSTVDNHRFGSSTKLLHTVVGQNGVMQGRQSDLLVGLPQQSVMVGNEMYHEPMRLTVVIEADHERISTIVAKHQNLQYLTRNKWFTLVAYDSATNTFYQYATDGEWLKI